MNMTYSSLSSSNQPNWWLFGVCAGIVLALAWMGGLAGPIGQYDLSLFTSGDGKAMFSIPAGRFILLFGFTWIACLALLLVFPRFPDLHIKCILLIGLALAVRLLLIPHPASDDINRYLWEGHMVSQGLSPYVFAPNHPALQTLAQGDPYHALINHPDMPAAYPPVTLYLFSLASSLYYHPITIKLIIIAFDMGAIWFLLQLLRHRGYDPRWAVLYAFNPVILYSFSGQAHFDAIQLFFLLGALVLYDRKRWSWMFLLAGLAIQTKYMAAVALPFLIRRENWPYVVIAAGTIIVPFLPFLLWQEGNLFGSLIKFGSAYAFNGSLHGILRVSLGGIAPATAVSMVLATGALLAGYFHFHPQLNGKFRDDPVSGCFYALGVLLLTLPTVHLWYLSWVLPFLALRPSAAWMLLCLSSGWYFVATGIQHDTGHWHLPVGYQLLEWLPFWVLLLYEGYLAWQRPPTLKDIEMPKTVSVVIPVRNEADEIGPCIDSARSHPAVREVIVVDGGSTDQTATRASNARAQVIQHTAAPGQGGGRGGQIHAGVKQAKGDVVVVMHADTRLAAVNISGMLTILARQPMIVGGAVGGVFDAKGWRLRLIELLNDSRVLICGISFGDQVQFFRRRPVQDRNLYPNLPLMEDVELSLRLSRLGRQTYLFGTTRISSRKWEVTGWRHPIKIIGLFSSYLWQRIWHSPPDTLAMYRRYYKASRD